MRMSKKGMALVAVLSLSLMVSGCAIAGIGDGSQVSVKYDESESYTAGGGVIDNTVTSVIVHAKNSNIEFAVSDQGTLSVEDKLDASSDLKEEWQLHYRYDGLTLYVEEYASEVSIVGAPQKTIVVYVPAGNTYAILEGESSRGSVTASGITADELELETRSGEITVSDATARSMSVEASSGNIKVENVTSSAIEGETGSGNLEVILQTQPYRVELETKSGNVHMALPEDPGFTLKLSLGEGMLIDSYKMTEETGSGKDSKGSEGSTGSKDSTGNEGERTFVVGTGENRYKIETKSGEINMEVTK